MASEIKVLLFSVWKRNFTECVCVHAVYTCMWVHVCISKAIVFPDEALTT